MHINDYVWRWWVVFALLAMAACLAPKMGYPANTHGVADPTQELQYTLGDTSVPFLVSQSCLPSVPGASLTFGAFSCSSYVKNTTTGALVYVTQPSAQLGPLNSGDGTYWALMHRDVSTAVGGWTRQSGTHYMWQKNASQPANPNGGLVIGQITVSGSVITAIVPAATASSSRNPSMGILYAADYGVVCDGATETSAKLQQAITLAAANKVSLQLPGGTCVIRTGMTVPTNAHIIGAANGELYWDTPAAGPQVVLDVVEAASEVIIEYVRIRSTNTTAAVNVTYNSNYPIRLNRVSASIVRNCHLQDFWGNAGILIGPGATAANHSDSNLIEGNVIVRGSAYGILITGGDANRIFGNYLEDASIGQANGGTSSIKRNTWTANTIIGVLNTNISVVIGGLVTDTVNKFIDNTFTGVSVSGSPNFYLSTLARNLIVGATTATAAAAPIGIVNANGSLIQGNTIDATNYTAAATNALGAFYCTTCASTIIADNFIANAPNAHGVGINVGSQLTVRGNTITANGGNGIQVIGANTDVTLEGNVIFDNNPGNNAAYFGIVLVLSGGTPTRTVVRGNRIYSPASNKQGVPLSENATTESMILDNILYPRQAANAFTTTGTNPYIRGNKLAAASLCGTITMTATPTVVVTNANVNGANIQIWPISGAAGVMEGTASKNIYISATTTFASFTVATVDAANATAGALYGYCIAGN